MMNMKKMMAMLMALMMMFALVACGGKEEAADKLVVGTSADYAPFEFHKMIDGKDTILGADIEMAKKIAADMGKELEIKDISFDALLNELQGGTIDIVIAGMGVTDDRLEKADASDNYYDASHQALIIRKEDADKYTSFDDFDGVKVAVQTGTIQIDLATENMTGCELVQLQSAPDLFNNLLNNKVDAVVVDGSVGLGYVAANEGLMEVDVDFPVQEGMSVWVQKDDPKGLMESINKTIADIVENDTYAGWVAEAEEQAAE